MRSGSGVVAFAGVDGEAFALHADFDGVIVEGAIRTGWGIGQGVLIAGFFRGTPLHSLHGVALGREVDVSSSVMGVIAEAAKAAFKIGAADGDAIAGDAVT